MGQFLHSSGQKLGTLKMTQNENLIIQKGYKEIFLFYEIFWLLSQILDFTLWNKSTVVEFSKGQFHRI